MINNIFINAYFTFLFAIDHRLSISFIEYFSLSSPRRKRIASFGWRISFDEWKTFVKISLKIVSYHDQNIFFCKTLCQSLSSPRPRIVLIRLSLKIFSHHDQNIFFCKTLCQSLSSPRPRVASRVSAATWMEESNKKTVSKHPTPPGLGEQPLCPLRDILEVHLR